MNGFDKAMAFRHSCRIFDKNRKISKEDIQFIVEAGRKSPSSFGLEPWHFLVIKNDEIQAEMCKACWDQPQVSDCSHMLVLLSRKTHFFESGSPHLYENFSRMVGTDPAVMTECLQVFDGFLQYQLQPSLVDWAKMQTYLASGNMLTAAAYIGIDSCALEGFTYSELEAVLSKHVPSFNKNDFAIAYCIAFGYRAAGVEQTPQIRYSLDEVSTFIE